MVFAWKSLYPPFLEGFYFFKINLVISNSNIIFVKIYSMSRRLDSKSPKKELINAVKQYFKENPRKKNEIGYYDKVGKLFNIEPERVRSLYRRSNIEIEDVVSDDSSLKKGSRHFKENVATGQADIMVITDRRVKTLEDLLDICQVDEKEWEVSSYEVTTWEGYRKDKKVDLEWNSGVSTGYVEDSGKLITKTLYRVSVKLSRRRIGKDLILQKEALLAELRAFSPSSKLSVKDKYTFDSRTGLLEICVFDPHFGKLAWREETGEDYDLKIAEARVKKAINDLLGRVNLLNVKKILFPIGNDLINVDNKNNTTAAGTPQDTDVRFMKVIRIVRRILIEIIDELSTIAPVDVMIVPGNHDTTSMFMMGEILDAFFFNNERVSIDNSPKLRKYYQFGKNGFQFTHGNEEKHDSLGLIFATEEPKLWADSIFRFAQLGHFHKNKTTNYVSVDQYQGYMVQVLPSLSGIDAWHYKKGYGNLKQAKAFLYDETEGLIGEFTTTVNI